MGVVFFVGFLLLAILVGIGFLLLGIIGMIVKAVLHKKGKLKNNRPLLIPSSICLCLATGCLAPPLLYFGAIFIPPMLPPLDYVATDIVIEEKGYQKERFTADGVVYTKLPLHGFRADTDKPVFAYKTPGLLNGHARGNYYALSNDGDFDLVHDGNGTLFCPESQRDGVLAYYHYQKAEKSWYGQRVNKKGKKAQIVPGKELEEQLSALKAQLVDLTFKPFEPEERKGTTLYYSLISTDGVVSYYTFRFELYEEEGYLVRENEYSMNHYTAIKLENDLFAKLKAAAG